MAFISRTSTRRRRRPRHRRSSRRTTLPARSRHAVQHREGLVPGFTKRYGCKLLVYYEAYDDLQDARLRELQMKEWKRSWKIRLIEEKNLEWDDLYPTLF